MSALNKAFIKAFARDTAADDDAARRAAEEKPRVESAPSPPTADAASAPAGDQTSHSEGAPNSPPVHPLPAPHFHLGRGRGAKPVAAVHATTPVQPTMQTLAEAAAPTPEPRREAPSLGGHAERAAREEREEMESASAPAESPPPEQPHDLGDFDPADYGCTPTVEAIGWDASTFAAYEPAQVQLDWETTVLGDSPAPATPEPTAETPAEQQESTPSDTESAQHDADGATEQATPESDAGEQHSIGDEQPSEQPSSTAPASEAESVERFQPVWEVDRFVWPEVCRDMAEQSQCLGGAGERLLAASRDGLKVLAVSSSTSGEGRTTIALALARAAAEAGVHTALIDADLTNPQMGRRLGLDTSWGWQDVIAENLPLAEAAIFSVDDRLTLLPFNAEMGRQYVPQDPRMTDLLGRVAEHFDLIVIDTGPLDGGDAVLFESGDRCPIDAAVLVCDCRHTDPSTKSQSVKLLQAAGIEAVGLAENFLPATRRAAQTSRAA